MEVCWTTMKRRYNPNVPVYISDEEEKHETKKIGVKVVKRSNSEIKEEAEEEVVTFKIEIDIPLRWVMVGYCEKLGLNLQTTRFEFNGAMLREMDTPHQLAMVHDDVIFAFPIPGGSGNSDYAHYVTLCIRVHKETDRFLRVTRSTAILPQLMRYFPDSGPQEQGNAWFVYCGLKLSQNHTPNQLNMEDGDIIDVFNSNTMSSSLSIIRPRITLKVRCVSGNETLFSVTQNTRMYQLMDKLKPPNWDSKLRGEGFMFIFNGRRLHAAKTVEEAQLKDGDEIDSHICQTGC